jgi:hypothetical protein
VGTYHELGWEELAGRLKPGYQKGIHVLLVVIIALLAYANNFSVPFQLDDAPIIKDNLIIQDIRFIADPSQAEGSFLDYYLKLRFVNSFPLPSITNFMALT